MGLDPQDEYEQAPPEIPALWNEKLRGLGAPVIEA
jgi:hypothetical protein